MYLQLKAESPAQETTDLNAIDQANRVFLATLGDARRAGVGDNRQMWQRLEGDAKAMRAALTTYAGNRLTEVGRARTSATGNASYASTLSAILALCSASIGIILVIVLTRYLVRTLGVSVRTVQTSVAELRTSAGQQSTTAQEQSQQLTELNTTMQELQVTARQIEESASQVAQATLTAAQSATHGTKIVEDGRTSMTHARNQVQSVVTEMLKLGRKSQEIGSVVKIISELSEQTNILSVNATIEAAGAGDAGIRFAAVALEIRKLADRVSTSTRDIATLIDEIRAAVNATVMATEAGSKAVESGTDQFSGIVQAFGEIGEMVQGAAQAAQEIRLSTQQQYTGVQQASAAIADCLQASRETDIAVGQVLESVNGLDSTAGSLRELIESKSEVA